jgi:hypothetical protein
MANVTNGLVPNAGRKQVNQRQAFSSGFQVPLGLGAHRYRVGVKPAHGDGVMEINEYRLHAAECLCIADEITEPKNKMLLLAMAQSWLKLAQQVEEGTPTRVEAVLSRRNT